jgi:hypothetical protein
MGITPHPGYLFPAKLHALPVNLYIKDKSKISNNGYSGFKMNSNRQEVTGIYINTSRRAPLPPPSLFLHSLLRYKEEMF